MQYANCTISNWRVSKIFSDVQFALFSKSGFSDSLQNIGNDDSNLYLINLDDLDDMFY